MSPFGTLEEARLAGYALRSSNFAFGNNNSLPPCVGRLGWGGEVAMKLACCSFTHPLTPSRQGRGDLIGGFNLSFVVNQVGNIIKCTKI